MFGFAPATREVRIPPDGPPPVVELALLPLAEMTRGLSPPVPVAPAAATAPATQKPGANACARGARQGRWPHAGAEPGQEGRFQRAARIQPRPRPGHSGRRERLPRRRQRWAQRRRHGCGRRTVDQRRRQQRRRIASRRRAFGNNAWRPWAVQRRLRPARQQFGVRLAAVFVHVAAGAQAGLQRLQFVANFGGRSRSAPDAPGPQLLWLPASGQHLGGRAAADADRRSGGFSRRAGAFGQRCRWSIPSPAGRFRQHHPGGSDHAAGHIASWLLSAAERRGVEPTTNTDHREDASGQRPARLTHQFRNGRERVSGAFQYQRHDRSANLFSLRGHHADHRSQRRHQPLAPSQSVHVPRSLSGPGARPTT